MNLVNNTKEIFNSIESDSVIISFSGGKDSLVLLDLAHKHFKTVKCFFMYMVKGISFIDNMIKYVELKYNTEVKQYPHFALSKIISNNTYRLPNSHAMEYPKMKLNDVYNKARYDFGIEWVMTGMKLSDSLSRRLFIRQYELQAINRQSKVAYPISQWTNKDILSYIKLNKLKLPENFGMGSFGVDLLPDILSKIKSKYPDDYNKILNVFPFADISIKHKEMYGKQNNKISEVCTDNN